MASRKLPNYLRTHRKRSYLTQVEVAYLLGVRNGANISRYELHRRPPSLETAIAYTVVFGEPIQELLAGSYDEIALVTKERARRLSSKLRQSSANLRDARKLETLDRIILS